MTLFLQQLDIPVIGYSLKAEKDSLYDRAKLKGRIPEDFSDIRNYKKLKRFIVRHQPSVIIHMAAQPLVLESYETPRKTFDTNVMGTVNILDIAFSLRCVQALQIVTTDKVYRNDNSGRSFVESDALEGKDPYSASKVGTEAVVKAWQQIAQVSGGPKIVSVRAGNVIGGGDFAKNRIIPDLVRSILINQENVVIRNLGSSRPWQHVLDVLIGYVLALEASLLGESEPAYNFGPSGKSLTVKSVAEKFISLSGSNLEIVMNKSEDYLEASSLHLNSTKSHKNLNWKSFWTQTSSIEQTFTWWSKVLHNNISPLDACVEEIQMSIKNLEPKKSSAEC